MSELKVGIDGFITIGDKTFCARRAESVGFGDTPFRSPEKDEWKEGRCSWCGSMTPDALFEAITAGTELGPTDKSYKVYVGERGKFYFQHFSEAHMAKFIGIYNDRDENGKRPMNIGYPGHFYVLPFFMKLRP